MRKKSKSKWSWAARTRTAALVAFGICGLSLTGTAQQLEGHLRLDGSEVSKAFEPLREVLQKSSAVMLDGWKSIGYGVVVSADGYIVTKASEVEDVKKLSVRVDKKEYKKVEIVATSSEWDVALLRIEALDLRPVTWSTEAEPEHGTWVVSNGATSRLRRRVRVGIISANPREVGGGTAVVLGVRLKADEDRLVVGGVEEESGAAEAGLKDGDILLEAEGTALEKQEELLELLSNKEPGDKLSVKVDRDGEQLEFEVELKPRHKVFEAPKSRNDAMSGRFSARRTNFKRILQHDAGLSERSTGGPLLDLRGRCVGMNIARVNRSETFAIPAKEIQELIEELCGEVEGGGKPEPEARLGD